MEGRDQGPSERAEVRVRVRETLGRGKNGQMDKFVFVS